MQTAQFVRRPVTVTKCNHLFFLIYVIDLSRSHLLLLAIRHSQFVLAIYQSSRNQNL
jgi:hypothetical protein